MTLERLRIFIAVAERNHVTAAAKTLNLTQSAVSNAIAALEAEHGVSLFDRVGRGVALNETGRAFLPEARAVLARAAAAGAVLADLSGLRRGRLAVFASQTIASYWLPERLVAFYKAHPGVELSVQIGNTREAAEAVLSGAAELGLVEGEVDEPGLIQSRIGADEVVVVVRPDHPWAGRRKLIAKDLVSGDWVLREPGSGTRSTMEIALREAGVALEALVVTMALPSNEAVLAAVMAGGGAAALSRSVAQTAIASGALVVAPFALPERVFRLIRHAERYGSRAGDAFSVMARRHDRRPNVSPS